MIGSFGSGTLERRMSVVSSGASAVRFCGHVEVVEPLLLARGVDRPGDVLGSERLAVRPLHVRAELVGPGLPVLRALPRLGERGDDREVAGRLVGERRVLDVPGLVGGDRDPDQRAHAVDALRVADVEDGLIAALLLALCADRNEAGQQQGERDRPCQPPAKLPQRESPSVLGSPQGGLSQGFT